MDAAQYLQHLRAKPHYVRERIVLGAALAVTLLVAAVWAATLSVSGAFSLATPAPADSSAPLLTQFTPTASPDASTNFSQLLGAVGAAQGSTSQPALVIEDQGSSSTLDRQSQPSDATVITF